MKKKILIGIMALLTISTLVWAGMQDRFSEIELTPRPNNYIRMPELPSAPSTPVSGWGKVYTSGNDIYFKDDAGVATSMIGAAAGGVSDLDEAYDGGGAGAGAEIAVDAGPVIFTGTHGTENTTNLTASGTGNVIDITNTGSGKDIDGTGSTWSFTKLGALTLLSADAFTGLGNITMDDGVGASPQIIFKDATDETATFDKTDSGALVLTTLAADGLRVDVGNLWVGNGVPGVATMDGEDAYVEGELEVDGAVQLDGAITATSTLGLGGAFTLENGLVLGNAVNNTYAWTENGETVKWTFNSNDLAFADGGSGVTELSFLDTVADAILSHAADGDADDFYIKQTGAHDASLIVSSTGTGADALQITTSAGGIVATSATGITLAATSATTLGAAVIHSGIQDVPAGGTSTVLALTNSVFTVGADAGGDIVTLANGTAGQVVYIICEDEAGITTITPATFNGGTSITFDALGDAVTLVYTTGTGWSIVGGNSYTII